MGNEAAVGGLVGESGFVPGVAKGVVGRLFPEFGKNAADKPTRGRTPGFLTVGHKRSPIRPKPIWVFRTGPNYQRVLVEGLHRFELGRAPCQEFITTRQKPRALITL